MPSAIAVLRIRRHSRACDNPGGAAPLAAVLDSRLRENDGGWDTHPAPPTKNLPCLRIDSRRFPPIPNSANLRPKRKGRRGRPNGRRPTRMAYDLLIRNGRIVDGSGMPAFKGDLAVKDGIIVEIGKINGAAARTIDADGLAVSPGFI